MINYYTFGLHISSEIELPGITEIECNTDPDVKIIRDKIDFPKDNCYYFIENEDIYLLWDDIGKIKICSGKIIIVDTDDENIIIPYILGPVMGFLLHQRGFLVLHGSSVKINNGAIAFIGNTGSGKSTTAINLYKRNYPLVTDDLLAISFKSNGIPYVNPGYHHVRLSKSSYNYIKDDTVILTHIRTIKDKLFCDASCGFSLKPLILKKIYFLEIGEQMELTYMDSQDNVLDLISHSIANKIFKINDQAENLKQCSTLINNVPIRRLKLVHSYNDINGLINLIENDKN